MRSADRLALLNVQGNLCSDDEIAYHLGSLASGSAPFGGPYPAILTIDPLLSTAWLDDCAFPIERWACEHPEVLKRSVQVVGACRLAQLWVPFQIVPCGSHATVYTWDAPVNDHTRLNQMLGSLALVLGSAQSPFLASSGCFQCLTNVVLLPFISCTMLSMELSSQLMLLRLNWCTKPYADDSLTWSRNLNSSFGHGFEALGMRKLVKCP